MKMQQVISFCCTIITVLCIMLLVNSQKRTICWNDSCGGTLTLLLENCTRNIISGSEKKNGGTVQQRLNVLT